MLTLRREWEQYATAMTKLDFNTDEEKQAVEVLNEEDRSLPAIDLLLPLLRRGIGVHSGLLPTLEEVVELLFPDSLCKALFATKTFAMGLNMPAKTVVLTNVRKWDGQATDGCHLENIFR